MNHWHRFGHENEDVSSVKKALFFSNPITRKSLGGNLYTSQRMMDKRRAMLLAPLRDFATFALIFICIKSWPFFLGNTQTKASTSNSKI